MKIRDESNVPEFLKMLSELEGSKVEIGVLGDDKGGNKHGDMTMSKLATIHEYGAPKAGIPERSFIRAGYDANKSDYIDKGEKILEDVMALNLSPTMFFETMGEYAVGQTQEFLTDLSNPPLKAATIMKKGSSNPLIDSGQLRDSITFKVRRG